MSHPSSIEGEDEFIDPHEAIDAIITNKDEVTEVLQGLTAEYSGRADGIDEEDHEDVEANFSYISPVDRHALVLPELHVDHRNEVDEGNEEGKGDGSVDGESESKMHVDYVSQLVYHIVKAGDNLISSTFTEAPPHSIEEDGDNRSQGREDEREDGHVEENDNIGEAGHQSLPFRKTKYIMHLGKVVTPVESSVCPLIGKVDESIEKQEMFLSIYSDNGYNFSNEFVRVYKGETSWSTSKNDFRVLICRALMASDTAMTKEAAHKYAEYILRISKWECKLSVEAAAATLESKMPDLKAKVESKLAFREVKLFIGADPISFNPCFWVRVCFPLIATEHQDRVAEKELFSFSRKPIKHKFIDICYCKKHILGQNELDDLDIGIADTGEKLEDVPLPPPKQSKPEDIGIYLMYDEKHRELRSFDDLLEDVTSDMYDYGVSMPKTLSGTITFDDVKPPSLAYLNVHSVYCSELIGWGENTNLSLGLPNQGMFSPQPLPIPKSLALEKVKMISCSPRHTLILSSLGNIYSCGENTEGALGLGDTAPRSSFELVMIPDVDGGDRPPSFISLAAGSGTIGSHSMAIEEHGSLYSWGVAFTSGLGSVSQNVVVPTKVTTFPLDLEYDSTNLNEEVDNYQDLPQAPNQHLVKSIACGGGFVVAIMQTGRVATWGMWTHGRLGLGPPPMVQNSSTSRYVGARKAKVARYCLRPRYVPGIFNATSVACGETHTLCIAGGGELYTWGQNTCGQLGVGVHASGFLLSHSRPVVVAPFSKPLDGTSSGKFNPVVHVCAGSYHSLAIDAMNQVWSWGARGAPCLGHNDVDLDGEWGKRINAIFSQSSKLSRIMVPYELMDWCSKWSSPRKLELPEDVRVSCLSAGDMHSTLLTTEGNVYLWGSGATVPAFVNVYSNENYKDDDDDDDDGSNADENTESEQDKKQSSEKKEKNNEGVPYSSPHIVGSPRSPSGVWLDSIASRRVSLVASAGCRIFTLLVDDFVAEAMAKLYRKAVFGSVATAKTASETGSEDGSLQSGLYSQGSSSSIFDQRGRVDCMLLVSGKVLLSHRALLAQRSPVLRDMIFEEYSGTISEITHILLPDLHTDTAKALLYFLYTDVLPAVCDANATLLRNLSRCGKMFKVPRLQLLCDHAIQALLSHDQIDNNPPTLEYGLEVPPSTITRDLSNMLGDQQFADVRFVIEGKELYAHRFILEARSEYFQAMFRSGMSESIEDNQQQLISVVVPDTYVGFLRMLTFIYTSYLPEAENEMLIDDLITADRYNLLDMRLACESMIKPDRETWGEILRVGTQIDSSRLLEDVKCYLCENTAALKDAIANGASSEELGVDLQTLLDNIMGMRREAYPSPPNQAMMDLTKINTKTSVAFSDGKAPSIPYLAIGAIVVLTAMYPYVQFLVSYGPVVPAINAAVTFLIAYMAYRYYTGGSGK